MRKRESDSASLRKVLSGQLFRESEAITGRQATNTCSVPAQRGGWGQRAPKDQSGTWEAQYGESQLNNAWESITTGWSYWESDRLIVAKTPGNAGTSEGA